MELNKYVATKLGDQAWSHLLNESGIGSKIYLAFRTYPDQEIIALVSAASKMMGTSVSAILEDFGEFIAPNLMKMYRHLIEPNWGTLDLIEHTEETIHHVVRAREPGAQPPALKCNRTGVDEVVITYSSPRKMCALVVGIAKGVAKYYNERILVNQPSCMLEGSSSCKISIRLFRTSPKFPSTS